MILKEVLKSKIHGAIITQKKLHYSGSLGVDSGLLKAADMKAGDKIQVLNFNNGTRIETYIIEEPEGSGTITLYGPAARCGEPGDKITIIAYALTDTAGAEELKKRIVILDSENRIKK